ncbi:RidA family protein [Cobetia marina]|uniref:RidA family protein n=1 Tax=Cobetia marina TaxID=28258 RepID=A0ABU9GGC4_COBMA|nr:MULTISPECIES: RidA family protein [Cobetia]MDO6786788.1 RidA family protein [Cobetia marina]POR07499.1 hypothetical protein BOH68_08165 [Cobetia sp. MM1IDA2H-1]TKD63115.1 RidA family protein [Cobetia marina]GED44122.1 hypothetical protein HHA02_34510 [Cobetia marina]
MSDIQRHDTKARMSRAVIHNNTIYLCGQVAGPEQRFSDITDQANSMLARVDALLEEVGTDREHLLSATVYLKTMDDFKTFNDIWDTWVPEGHAPARACVQAAMASPELLCEITVVAAVK